MSRIVRLFVVLALVFASPLSAGEFFFRDGDRVIMIGDSITEQHLYSNYVEMWVSTRFPKWNLTFRNVGIGGDRSPGGNSRFARDVLSHKPTAMTVDFGMNDGGYRAFDEAGFKTYMDGLQGMAEKAKAAGIGPAWCTPQPLDNAEQGPTALTAYNLTLEKYSDGVRTIAEKNGGVFVDQFHPYLAVLDKARAAGPTYSRITAGDAVHPGPPGQALMAFSILKGLGFPRFVSSVELDVQNFNDINSVNCIVSGYKQSDDVVSFTRADEALPFFPAEAASILQWSPILEDANDYSLRVKGLTSGNYEVRLGETSVAKYSAEQLAAGVNLAAPALAAGPVARQVNAVRTAIAAKNSYHHDQIFRGVVLSNVSVPEWLDVKLTPAEIESKRQAVVAERLSKLPELDAAICKALEIAPHTVTVSPVK